MSITLGAADRDTFAEVAERHRDAIRVHCYRMLGSVHDAEDATQDALLLAWRSFDTFEGRSATSTWLHRIATNVCLTRLRERQRSAVAAGHDLGEAVRDGDVPWLTPMPSRLLPGDAEPDAAVERSEAVRLAFVAALQFLPARQRACVILKDVLEWSAAEIADALGTTTASVNSALQRARATLADRDRSAVTLGHTSRVVETWLELWHRADVAGLARLLAEDAIMSMPPEPVVFRGRDPIIEFLVQAICVGPTGAFRLVPTEFNGGPALAAYAPEADGTHRAYGVMLLESRGGLVDRITGFRDPRLPLLAGLPEILVPGTA